MTNEKQAAILSGRALGFSDGITKEKYDIAMKMAQWKDKQFVAEKQELIDDVCFLLVANLVKTHLFSIDSIVELVTRFRQSIEETK